MRNKTDEERTADYIEKQFTDEFTGGSFIPPEKPNPLNQNPAMPEKGTALKRKSAGHFVKIF